MLEIQFLFGDLLVEGVIEGKYTGIRNVNSDADIYITNKYEKERKEPFVQQFVEKTGKKKNSVEVYFNKFKIFFNKRLPKFEKCDTIRAYKKVKLFSNYYLPLEIVKITDYEIYQGYKEYSQDELISKIEIELQEEIKKENNVLDTSNVNCENEVKIENDGIHIKTICTVEDKIGTKG